jgi:hypothetical protein
VGSNERISYEKTAIFAAMLLLGAARAGAQVAPWQTDDSCLCLYQDYYPGLWYNPDSVMVDSCSPYIWDIPLYAKRWYRINLDSDYFHFPAAPIDTIIQTTWQQLDTIYDTARAEFDSLQRQYGPFVLRKFYPDRTTGEESGAYHIGFDSLLQVDAVLTTLEGLIDESADFSSFPNPIDNAVNSTASGGIKLPSVYPNPFSQSATITFTCPNQGPTQVSVVNLLGVEVALLFSGDLDAGEHTFSWDAHEMPPGMYGCVVRLNGSTVQVPMMLLR